MAFVVCVDEATNRSKCRHFELCTCYIKKKSACANPFQESHANNLGRWVPPVHDIKNKKVHLVWSDCCRVRQQAASLQKIAQQVPISMCALLTHLASCLASYLPPLMRGGGQRQAAADRAFHLGCPRCLGVEGCLAGQIFYLTKLQQLCLLQAELGHCPAGPFCYVQQPCLLAQEHLHPSHQPHGVAYQRLGSQPPVRQPGSLSHYKPETMGHPQGSQ